MNEDNANTTELESEPKYLQNMFNFILRQTCEIKHTGVATDYNYMSGKSFGGVYF